MAMASEEVELNLLENEDNYDDEEDQKETDFGGHDDSFTPFRPFHGESSHNNPVFEPDEGVSQPLLQETKLGIVDFIKSVYVKSDFSKISYGENKDGIWVSLGKSNSVKYYVTGEGVQDEVKNGVLKNRVPKEIEKALGLRIVDILDNVSEYKSKIDTQITELQGKIKRVQYEFKEQKYKLEKLKNDKGRLQKQVKVTEDRLDEYNKENRKLKNDLEKSTSPQERKELEKKLKEQELSRKDIEKELKELKDKLNQDEERNNEKIRELKEKIENSTNEEEIQEFEEQIEQLEIKRERQLLVHEELFERLSLRNKVKYIFKKYGFTVFSILTAVGTVIGVIVSNLSSGLASVAKGLGNGLKALAKRVAKILPGMVGAIASFLFKTAGEALGFLAKNSWLLILLLVTFVVEKYSKKK